MLLKRKLTNRPLLPPIGVAALAFALTVPAAQAEEISSAYTALEVDKCKDVTPADAKDYGTVWRCEGYDDIDVRVAEGDLRIFVSFGPNAENQTAAQETLPQFNTIGEKLEWRLVKDGDKQTPFATILRYGWKVDGRSGGTLVVTKLGKDDACHMAYVAASGNPKANEQARAIADKDARKFVCKRDTAKHYDATGKETAP
jgi:hypothetical protein